MSYWLWLQFCDHQIACCPVRLSVVSPIHWADKKKFAVAPQLVFLPNCRVHNADWLVVLNRPRNKSAEICSGNGGYVRFDLENVKANRYSKVNCFLCVKWLNDVKDYWFLITVFFFIKSSLTTFVAPNYVIWKQLSCCWIRVKKCMESVLVPKINGLAQH